MANALEIFSGKLGFVRGADFFCFDLNARNGGEGAAEHIGNLEGIRFERQYVFLSDGGKMEHARKTSGKAAIFIDSLLCERGFCIA
jgi:hypothetical protein